MDYEINHLQISDFILVRFSNFALRWMQLKILRNKQDSNLVCNNKILKELIYLYSFYLMCTLMLWNNERKNVETYLEKWCNKHYDSNKSGYSDNVPLNCTKRFQKFLGSGFWLFSPKISSGSAPPSPCRTGFPKHKGFLRQHFGHF